jgi:hypothetical protein
LDFTGVLGNRVIAGIRPNHWALTVAKRPRTAIGEWIASFLTCRLKSGNSVVHAVGSGHDDYPITR